MPDDPCESNTCSIYAECVADIEMPTNYSCACIVGFEGDGFNCYGKIRLRISFSVFKKMHSFSLFLFFLYRYR